MSIGSDQPLISNQVPDTEFPDNFEEFSEIFGRDYKRTVDAINTKEGGLYSQNEVATFQKYFNPNDSQSSRNIYRKVINFDGSPTQGQNACSMALPSPRIAV